MSEFFDDYADDEGCDDTADEMRDRYDDAKAAEIGTMIACATCGASLRKRQYAQVFCSNSGRGNCKDRYWNLTDEARRARAEDFA